MHRLAAAFAGLLLALFTTVGAAVPPSAQPSLQFDGSGYVEVPDSSDFSVSTSGRLTISAWMRPDVLRFSTSEGSGYVYWLGKGERGQQEWVFRMYSAGNTEQRANRISFYLFNAQGGLGIGSYFQDPITPGEWIHVVGVADTERTAIYKNGVFRKCDQYRGAGDGSCQQYRDLSIAPQHGTAPLRMGTRDFGSYFQGGLAEVRLWNRALSGDEIADLYATDSASPDGLVAEYLLHDGAGSVAHDTAGGHDGTIVGATWSMAAGSAAVATDVPEATHRPRWLLKRDLDRLLRQFDAAAKPPNRVRDHAGRQPGTIFAVFSGDRGSGVRLQHGARCGTKRAPPGCTPSLGSEVRK